MLEDKLKLPVTPERLRPGCPCHGEGEKVLARSPTWAWLTAAAGGTFSAGGAVQHGVAGLCPPAAASLAPQGSGTDDSSLIAWQSAAKAPAKLRVPRASPLRCA